MIKILLVTTLFLNASVTLAYIPQSFDLPSTLGGKAVFTNFTNALYKIKYDVKNKSSTYIASINFTLSESGKPIFDAVTKPTSIMIDGVFVKEFEITTPSLETKVRVIDKILSPGTHNMEITGDIVNLVEFNSGTVSAAHWTDDLDDRGYLEAYLPSNFEYDQYQMTFDVQIIGSSIEHKIYSNGDVSKKSKSNSFIVKFPKSFNASSGYYHIVPINKFKEYNFNFTSISGKVIPVTIYGREYIKSYLNPLNSKLNEELPKFPETTVRVLKELEQDYGPFPHNKVVIYNNGRGGMEYCGATMTELWALAHELTHSYFARGIMPANGNAGWIDEALASWRDNAYPRNFTMDGTSKMSNHPIYTRYTDRLAYTYGASFISYLDGTIASNLDSEGLKNFLRHAIETKTFTPYTVEDFVSWMEQYYNYKFMLDFKTFTYGENRMLNPSNDPNSKRTWGNKSKNQFDLISGIVNYHPIHRKLTISELQNFL